MLDPRREPLSLSSPQTRTFRLIGLRVMGLRNVSEYADAAWPASNSPFEHGCGARQKRSLAGLGNGYVILAGRVKGSVDHSQRSLAYVTLMSHPL
jgi:hypothetical protein